MTQLPELSESTKRKLAIKWDDLVDSHRLTGEHLQWHEKERDRLRRVAAQSGDVSRRRVSGEASWRDDRAADAVGIKPSVAVATARFLALAMTYWCHWSPRSGYEIFTGWLDMLRGQTLREVASVWTGRSDTID